MKKTNKLLASRSVLVDCQYVYKQFDSYPTGVDWKLKWILSVTLLQTIGEVLLKIDKQKGDIKLAKSIATIWSKRKDEKIYQLFIRQYRNKILHQYDLHAGQGFHGKLGDPNHIPYTYPIKKGAFAGRDQRELIKESIDWWDSVLSEIEYEYRL